MTEKEISPCGENEEQQSAETVLTDEETGKANGGNLKAARIKEKCPNVKKHGSVFDIANAMRKRDKGD